MAAGDPDDYAWLMEMFGGGDDDDMGPPAPPMGPPSPEDPMGPPDPPMGPPSPDPDPMGPPDPPMGPPSPTDPGGGGGGFDLGGIEKLLGLGAGTLKAFMTATGLTLKDVLALTAGTAATVNANKMSKEGVAAIQKATGESKDLASAAMAKVSGNYKPYMDTGVKSNADLYAMVGNNNMLGKFNQNAPKFTPMKSYMSLADLAQYRS